MKVLFVLLVCSAAVAMAQRRPGGGRGPGGRGRGPRYTVSPGGPGQGGWFSLD